jgi:hypothetical protein
MMRTTAFLLVACLISGGAVRQVSPSEDLKSKLNEEISSYHIPAGTFVGALIKVSGDFHIPMGIVWVDSPASLAQSPFDRTHATPDEIIRDIVRTQPGYEVHVGDGIVHIFRPIQDNENFLKIRVGRFSANDQPVELAEYRLHSAVAPIKGNHQISIAGPGDSRVTLQLSDPTVEDVLDAISVASNRKIWIATFSDDAGLTPRGLRRTLSLWNDKPSEPDQPGWDVIRWGDPLPPMLVARNP